MDKTFVPAFSIRTEPGPCATPRRFAPVAATVLALFFVSSATSAWAGRYWQLELAYDAQRVSLVRADPIPPLVKKVRTPGLGGAPLRIAYTLSWLDAKGAILSSTPVEAPLGVRASLAEGDSCRPVMPAESAFVLRVAGPDVSPRPAAIRLSGGHVQYRALGAERLSPPVVFQADTLLLALPASTPSLAPVPGPVSVEKMSDSGPDSNRLVIVVMGDGYTAANLSAGIMTTHATAIWNAFQDKAPWGDCSPAVNVYRIDVESAEEGADNPGAVPPVYVDTYLNSSFWVGGTERLLYLTGDGVSLAYAAANEMVGVGVWDEILVTVNSTKYGGGGGAVAVTAMHTFAGEIATHEFGHSFGQLADEYDYGYTSLPGNDYEPNVDFDYAGAGLKWLAWVEAGTPLPTPDEPLYYGLVGAFEGAKYFPTGIYRPWHNCLMRSLGQPLCPVCSEAHVLELTDLVQLIDAQTPDPAQIREISWSGTEFSVTPLSISPLTYSWTLDGEPLAGAAGPSVTLAPDDVSGSAVLRLQIGYPTSYVRKTTIAETYSWNVSPPRAGVSAGAWLQY